MKIRNKIITPFQVFRRCTLTTVLVSMAIGMMGCMAFVSHYDGGSYQNFTSLKAFHLKFIDDFTEAEGKKWDEQLLDQKCDEGDLRFREAQEYELGKRKRDDTREKALKNLHDQFTSDCSALKKKASEGHFFLSPYFAQELKGQVGQNYNFAIKGEESRVATPKK